MAAKGLPDKCSVPSMALLEWLGEFWGVGSSGIAQVIGGMPLQGCWVLPLPHSLLPPGCHEVHSSSHLHCSLLPHQRSKQPKLWTKTNLCCYKSILSGIPLKLWRLTHIAILSEHLVWTVSLISDGCWLDHSSHPHCNTNNQSPQSTGCWLDHSSQPHCNINNRSW